ncbi:MAG: O-methyltransferase [Chitinophagaceae bacterium]|jgi:predicted O-methyltransferase YrrM
MDLIHQLANEYALKHSSPMDELLSEIYQYTLENHPESHMISGPLQGNLLTMISRMIQPKTILEIGTFTGYSAICLAKGLQENGRLLTIESRASEATVAKRFFDRSDFKEKILLQVGDAKEILKDLNESWDLVFVDADKTGYIDYFEMLMKHAKSGSWMLFDNVFFHGEVLKEKLTGKNAKAIDAFNEHVSKDPRVDKLMMTIRDGLTLLYIK